MISKRHILILISIILLSGCTLEVRECKDGETRCVGDSINTCANREWSEYSPCVKQKCEEQKGKAVCVKICDAGDTKCSGNVLLTCTEESIWPPVSEGTECTGDESCMSMQDFSFCANPDSSTDIGKILSEHDVECNDKLRMCGENNSLYTCENDELKELQQCGSMICDKAPDGIMACLESCQPGETKCDGNNLVTCTENGVFGKSTPCTGNKVCTKNDESVYACVEGTISRKECSEDQCIEDILYRCEDSTFDNGTKCEGGCGKTTEGKLACLPSLACTPGRTRCRGRGIEKCSESGVWKIESDLPEHSICMMHDEAAEYQCEVGYELKDGSCKAVCVESCSEDGTTSTFCPGDGTSVKIVCVEGCNPETKYCNDCTPVVYLGEVRCGIPLRTAEDILQLREAVNSGDLSKAPGKPNELSKAFFVVMNSIDIGEVKDWKGIGTTEHPFTGIFVGKNNDVTISGNIECLNDNCGFFGDLKNARIANLSFDIALTSEAKPYYNHLGRVAGSASESLFEHLTVKGHLSTNGRDIGGLVGTSSKSTYSHIFTSGIIEGTKVSDDYWYRVQGGVTGGGTSDVIKDSVSSVRIYTARDAVGGFVGVGKNCVFDNVSFIGILAAPLGTSLNPSRLGGIIGNGYAPNTIMNSRVIASVRGRDAIGGFVGKLDSTSTQGIINSFSVCYVTGERGVAGMVAYEASYQLQNVYSLSKSIYSISSQNASVINGYYDPALCTAPKGSGSISNGGTVVYENSRIMLETGGVSLVEQLNNNLEACNKKVPSGYSCHEWSESSAVNLENLVGLKDIKLPWQADRVLDEEYKAIESLNDDLSK